MTKRRADPLSSEEPAPKKLARERIDTCAICRGALKETCGECTQSGEDRVCLGPCTGAVCGHPFHMECIQRWVLLRPCCPLCSLPWIFPHGLSLAQLVAAKSVGKEDKVLELVASPGTEEVYAVLDQGLVLDSWFPRPALWPSQQRLLAHTFGHYLTVEELERLVADKKQRASKVEAKASAETRQATSGDC